MKLRDIQGELPNGKRVKWKNIDPEVNILVGENGSGKTMILKAIKSLNGISALYCDCGCPDFANQNILDSFKSGSEILLLDDIDSHLSFSKQETIIDEMRIINPNVQLFITTHSPFIYGDKWIGKVVHVEDLLT